MQAVSNLLVVVAFLSASGAAGAVGSDVRPPSRAGEVIVTFGGRVGLAAMQSTAVRGHSKARVARTLASVGKPHMVLVRFPEGVPVQEMVARMKALPGVKRAEPNHTHRLPIRPGSPAAAGGQARRERDGGGAAAASSGTAPWYPSDPDYPRQSGFSWLDADVIYPERALSPMVAVLSTGVDSKHPDLLAKVVKGTDWVNADSDPDDDFGLGTGLAGVIGAVIDNKQGIAGLSNGKVLAIKIMDSEGYSTVFDDAAAILEAANNPLVKVILFGEWWGADEILILRDAIQTAVSKGKLLILPAADLNSSTPSFPSAYADPAVHPTLAPSVISVAATGLPHYTSANDSFWDYTCKTSYSNYGPWISVDAPAEAVYSTTPTHPFWLQRHGVPNNYGYFGGGTITAAAQVAGVAARAWSVMPAGTSAAQVKQRIVSRGYDYLTHAKTVDVDTDGDGAPDTPCYPPEMNDASVTPDVAAIMGRTSYEGHVLGAHGGIELPTSATVSAFMGGGQRGRGGVTRVNDSFFRIVNLPMDNVNTYELKVTAPGYTSGVVTYHAGVIFGDCGGGTHTADCVVLRDRRPLSLPKNLPGQIHVVTNWLNHDLDTHLFTPSGAPVKCDVGLNPLSSFFCFLGSLTSAPFARLLHHGPDDRRSELLSIKAPLYPTTSGTPYRIVLTDFGNNWLLTSKAMTRIWTGGKIVGWVAASAGDTTTNDCSYAGGANTCGAFWVGDLSGAGGFTPKAIYGTLSDVSPGVLPYVAARGGGPGAGPRP